MFVVEEVDLLGRAHRHLGCCRKYPFNDVVPQRMAPAMRNVGNRPDFRRLTTT